MDVAGNDVGEYGLADLERKGEQRTLFLSVHDAALVKIKYLVSNCGQDKGVARQDFVGIYEQRALERGFY